MTPSAALALIRYLETVPMTLPQPLRSPSPAVSPSAAPAPRAGANSPARETADDGPAASGQRATLDNKETP